MIFVSTILTFLLYFQLKATLIIIIIFASFLTFFYIIFKNKVKLSGKITTTSREEVIKNVQILLNARRIKIFNKMGYFLSLLEQHSKSFTSNIVYYKSLFMIPRYYIEGIFILFVIFSFTIFTFIG